MPRSEDLARPGVQQELIEVERLHFVGDQLADG